MAQFKKALPQNNSSGTIKAIANVTFFLHVGHYEGVRKFNDKFAKEAAAINGIASEKINPNMAVRKISRGDIIVFGNEVIVNEETGEIEVYPKELFDGLHKRTVELPTEVVGELTSVYERTLSNIPALLRKQFEQQREKMTSRFNIVPMIEEYVGQEIYSTTL